MANYNVEVKIFRGSRGGDIEMKLKNYLNSLDSSKVIRCIVPVQEGTELTVLVIHDA